MKCPKCGYLGFEAVDRCRNCGYDFSLSSAPSLPDLSIRPAGTPDGPLDDLTLASPRPRTSTDALRHAAALGRADRRDTPVELPLFGAGVHDDAPLIMRPSPPRQPLAVRRSTPEVPRLRTEARPSLLDDPPVLWRPAAPVSPPPTPAAASLTPSAPRHVEAAQPVAARESGGLIARVLAGVVDLSVLIVVDATVVYFTLQICGLNFAEVDLLPRTPLFSYLAIQDLGYFAAFTAGGQTLGKMVAGVQVVVEGTDRAPNLPQALLRTLLWMLLALPAGLGLVSVLLDTNKRGLHDRLARTRVVRATP